MAAHDAGQAGRRPKGRRLGLGWALALTLGLLAAPAPAQEAAKLKIGFVTFLSGPEAGPFGVPARNAAELVVEALNAGKVPAPYDRKGIAGASVQSLIIDEAGGPDRQVAEYRDLVQRQEVDLVIGYASSSNCQAIAPVAEALKKLTVLFDCGTPRLFEGASYTHVFRTGAHATMDNVAAARYLLARAPDLRSFAGLNQDYAWGQDSWADFKASILQLKPGTEIRSEQFPKLGAGLYSTEIAALQASGAETIHSSLWGGDLEAFILQGNGRGLFANRNLVLIAGEPMMFRLGARLPAGIVIGARGPHGVFARPSPLNDWFRAGYNDRYGTWPIYASYKMAQAVFAVKAAYEKAAAGAGGGMPSAEQAIAAFAGLEFQSPSGKVQMALGNGHQAIQETAYGVYRFDRQTGEPMIAEVVYYPAECVNPPDGVKSFDWIAGGFQGAKCD